MNRSFSSRSLRAARRGFTLLEIMVVLAILGLLVAVLAKNVVGQFDGGQRGAAEIFVNSTAKLPLTSYRIDTGSYPSTSQGLQALISAPQGGGKWKGPYWEDGELPLDPWQEPYEYRYPGTHNKNSYDLFSKGPDKTAGTDDDIGNWK